MIAKDSHMADMCGWDLKAQLGFVIQLLGVMQ